MIYKINLFSDIYGTLREKYACQKLEGVDIKMATNQTFRDVSSSVIQV